MGCKGRFLRVAAGAAISALGLGNPAAAQPSAAPPAPPASAAAAAYVGREACVACHRGNAAGFAATGMGRSFQPLTPENVVEDFVERNELVDERSGLRYRMLRRDSGFYQRQFVLDSHGRETAVDERELIWVVGSNHHSRGYVTRVGNKLFQAPVCWDPTHEFWMFCPGFEQKNDHFSREISYSCMFCHNGRTELVDGQRNAFGEPLPHGIDCERCHGPGSEHLRYQRENPWADPAQPDPTIVNPARLPRRERIEVCFQCHLGDTTATVRVVRHGRSLASFRPGQRITEVLVPFRFVRPTQHDFGLVGQADRLLLSRCYLESEGRLECLTCHNPHVTVYDRPPGSFRDNCLTCHAQSGCTAPPSSRQATPFPDDCIACHMRKGEAADRRYARFTDHWIRRRIDVERDPRTDFELEPIFPVEFAQLSAAEQAYHLARANFLRGLESPPRIRTRLLERAHEAFERAIALGFAAADAWFFLGKTRMYLERWEPAVAALESALTADPGHHDAAFALGQSLTALGRFRRAGEVFGKMLQRDADDPMALSELGRVEWTLGRSAEAIAHYRRAVELEPWNAVLHWNLGLTLGMTGQLEAAATAADEAVRLDPDNPELWEFRLKVMHETGRGAAAQESRRRLELLRGGGK